MAILKPDNFEDDLSPDDFNEILQYFVILRYWRDRLNTQQDALEFNSSLSNCNDELQRLVENNL